MFFENFRNARKNAYASTFDQYPLPRDANNQKPLKNHHFFIQKHGFPCQNMIFLVRTYLAQPPCLPGESSGDPPGPAELGDTPLAPRMLIALAIPAGSPGSLPLSLGRACGATYTGYSGDHTTQYEHPRCQGCVPKLRRGRQTTPPVSSRPVSITSCIVDGQEPTRVFPQTKIWPYKNKSGPTKINLLFVRFVRWETQLTASLPCS